MNLSVHKFFLSPIFAIAALSVFLLALGSCAGLLPAPGGTDTINTAFYKTKDDFLSHLDAITSGMTEQEVLDRMGRKKEDMIRLSRDEIVMVLLGTNNVEFKDSQDSDHNFSRSLYGYKLHYKITERKHGFSSPIRITTNEKGFDYVAVFIFRDGVLFENPVLTGGEVNNSSSRTFFDFITPGTAINRIGG